MEQHTAGSAGQGQGTPMPQDPQGQGQAQDPHATQSGTTGGTTPSTQDPQGDDQGGQQSAPITYTPDFSHFETVITLAPHHLVLNDNYFLRLLAGSLSLTMDEKKRILDSISTLSQYQADKLIEIFEEEIVKFLELEVRMKEQIDKLRKQKRADWEQLEMEVIKEAKKGEDDQKAAEIRKKLGL